MKKLLHLMLLSLFVSMADAVAFGQIVSGRITDQDDGSPIPGVNIVKKGSTLGTVSDVNGHYQIELDPAEKNILVFSFLGYVTREVDVGKRTVVDVALSADVQQLQEVVVVGYGIQTRKSSLSYSVTTVKKHRQKTPSYSNESYAKIEESGFQKVTKKPLSTFSVDVDGASYSNMRRYIESGSLPPKDAVRVEEMINYFDYDYAQPEGETPFSVNYELSSCPWNKKSLLLHVGLQGRKIEVDQLPPSNIVFLIDVSGSMSDPDKLPLLKSSLRLLVQHLRPVDRVAMVVYAGSSGLVLPSTDGDRKDVILAALDKLSAGGSTAGGEGLKLAYKVAARNFIEEGNNRIVLATDGDFNVGLQSNDEMEELIEEERNRGISISVLGFGRGNIKDDKMEIIADKGNGNYSYIDNLLEAQKVLVSEFGGTFFTIAKDVKFQLEFNPVHVAEYRLIGYENRALDDEDFDNDKKDAGEIGAGHTVTALYEIVPAGKKGTASGLKYQNSQPSEVALISNDLVTLKLRYKNPDGFRSQLLEFVVKDEPVALEATSPNFRFSASVAQFGMLLRDSDKRGSATWESTYELAINARGDDPKGYRAEMIRLVETASLLDTPLDN
ncbi:von Willebrand factor type A domain-containing protein [uncultured Imperialibacter sp.]|uniref:vWA domain-containing protein n=1 Tax=uncultured Imperialibacter sp. TaxID=1672639 RepID=UPI0030DCEC58|tara:strand:+ start:36936 stop:38768 length:1833 start_codon:yes stop_codon:yes gene_type:complete